ncbi:hypothetical protein [Cohnella zeiphila]|uniref:Butirosin biosynthesis protein H N-terminal domain-containing protein n=1 Tax=Cohnella zeiphila TaxID=2761120 RepID=A0A7X0VTI5_9BACL|nr:hypothetical protein [Cohnella zeiphila]MBB6729981.1 hypothetical protein [Cohnella zeiphila]
MNGASVPPRASSLVSFGPMTCAESCVATFLDECGLDYRSFFMDYWNLVYESGTLLAGRNLKAIDLAPFGVSKRRLDGVSLQDCRKLAVPARTCLLLVTLASRLPYFPRQLLAFEERGFEHFIIVRGYDEARDRFQVADPTAGFSGELSSEELAGANPEADGGFRLWQLAADPGVRPADAAERLRVACLGNYRRCPLNGPAFERFRADLRRFAAGSAAELDDWASRNNVAVATVIKNRKLVWHSLAAVGCWGEDDRARAQAAFAPIVAGWTQLNLLLFKLGRHPPDPEALAVQIDARMEKLRRAEEAFLYDLHAVAEGGSPA